MTDIKKFLLQNQEQLTELEIFLTNYFGNSSQIEPNKILHGDGLIVEYNSDKTKIKSIIIDEKIVLKDDLIQKAKEALRTDLGIQVQSIFIHSPLRVSGYFRYEDKFQLLPAPKGAPTSEYHIASHAFNLEFSYKKSPHQQINMQRSFVASKRIILLLNSLLRNGIDYKGRSSIYEWALIYNGNEIKCDYVHLTYHGGNDDREKDETGFTSCSEYPCLRFVDTNSYYTTYGISGGEVELPENFKTSLSAFEKLDEVKRELFLRASYWTQIAYKTFPISLSAAFSALITSIEVFLPNPSIRCIECNRPISKDCCTTCYQPISGPTKQFRDFVEEYSPGLEEPLRKKLYDMRSSIVHGGTLMTADEVGLGFNPKSNEQSRNWRSLSQIVQFVQINWLHAQK